MEKISLFILFEVFEKITLGTEHNPCLLIKGLFVNVQCLHKRIKVGILTVSRSINAGSLGICFSFYFLGLAIGPRINPEELLFSLTFNFFALS
jgi:hypothetical protein